MDIARIANLLDPFSDEPLRKSSGYLTLRWFSKMSTTENSIERPSSALSMESTGRADRFVLRKCNRIRNRRVALKY